MLKKSLLIFIIFFWATSVLASTGYGNMHLKSLQLQYYQHAGNLKLSTVDIGGTLEVNGKLTAQRINLHDIVVNGSAQLKGGRISGGLLVNGKVELDQIMLDGEVTVYGQMHADECTFDSLVTVATSDITFEESVLNAGLHVKPSIGNKSQMLILEETTIRGDVVFESGQGVIKMDSASHIHGKIIGARVIQ